MTMISLRLPESVHLEKNDIHLFLDPQAPNWISTNRSGAEIIENLKKFSKKETAQVMSEKWGLDFEEALKDCKDFLEELKKNGFARNEFEKVSEYPGRSKVIDPGLLQELWIYTNNSCNLRCKHCFVSAGEIVKEEMSTDDIKALVDEAEALGVFRFYFTGGEPFLRKDIFDLIEHILRTDINELIILSNGTLFRGDFLKKLKKFRKSNLTLQVSLDGPNPEVNDATRGKGSFEKTVEGIKNLVNIGIIPIVTTTITSLNADHMDEITELLMSLGVKDHHILWLQNSGRAKKSPEGLEIPPEKVTKIMRDLIKKSKKLGIIVDNEMSFRVRAKAKRGRKFDLCNSCFEMLSVDSDGHVYPCAPLNGEKKFDCGSIKELSLKEIWLNSQQARRIRENSVVLKNGCKICNLKFICGGGCFCQSYFASKVDGKGDISAKDPYCSTNKSLFYDLLEELATPEDYNRKYNGYEPPIVFAAMDSKLHSCHVPSTKVKDFSHEIGTFHCSCVLAIDLEGDEGTIKGDRNRLTRDACFHELAHEYEEWLESPIGLRYDSQAKKRVFSLIDIKEGDHILEVGCGTGNYAMELVESGAKVTGVDASEWMLRIAIRNAKERGIYVEYEHAFGENLKFPDETFDAVLSMNMLEFSPNPKKAVEEMLRVLKKGGWLIIGVLNKNSIWGFTKGIKKTFAKGAYYEARFFRPIELINILSTEKSNGTDISSTIYFPPLNQRYVLKATEVFEKVGQRIFPMHGALITVKADKGF